MNDHELLIIEPLSSKQERVSFDCGVEELNSFLKQFAIQNQKKQFVRTYVCCRNNHVIGYYSLAFGSVNQEGAPEHLVRGMGRYQIPAMILGRLAVDKKEQGKGLGMALLKNAILRTKQAAQIAGLKAIIVHAKDSKARNFYEKYGFICSLNDPLTLFFPINIF